MGARSGKRLDELTESTDTDFANVAEDQERLYTTRTISRRVTSTNQKLQSTLTTLNCSAWTVTTKNTSQPLTNNGQIKHKPENMLQLAGVFIK